MNTLALGESMNASRGGEKEWEGCVGGGGGSRLGVCGYVEREGEGCVGGDTYGFLEIKFIETESESNSNKIDKSVCCNYSKG